MKGGAALKDLVARMQQTIDAAGAAPELAEFAASLAAAIDDIANTSRLLVGAMTTDVERALANATVYLDSLGHLVVAWRWLAQAHTAVRALPGAAALDRDFYRGKISACRFFFRYELPRIRPALELLRSLDDTALSIPDAAF